MNILISGGTGFIGSALTPALEAQGHSVSFLTRNPHGGPHREIVWDPEAGKINDAELSGFEAVIHLAGDGIAQGRWTPIKKARIRESRVRGTRILSQALAHQPQPPKVLISASAIGIYGDRPKEKLSETSEQGDDFLAEVCSEWETAAHPAKDKGIRVAHPRIGIVLGKNGGALGKMLLPFKLGLGGNLGSGQQVMSWVALEDVVGAFLFALENESVKGPFNVTAPHPATNAEFTKALGRALHRPTILPVPAFVLQLLMGEMADALLLSSARVMPEKLLQTGYQFKQPNLDQALSKILSK